MREFALTVTDSEVFAEINLLIAEAEWQARLSDNGAPPITERRQRAERARPCRSPSP